MIGVIAQARMTSQRFPGKTIFPLCGKPVLQHVLERANRIEGVDIVICAFPEGEVSDPIRDICRKLDVATFAGPEHDVLKRYWQAANIYELDVIMRITGDCPMINPVVCADVLKLLQDEGVDYASNVHPSRTFPKGYDCEVFTWECLDATHKLARSKYNREHVTAFMQKHDGIAKALLRQPIDESEVNLCVDFPEDIGRLEALIGANERKILEGVGNATVH